MHDLAQCRHGLNNLCTTLGTAWAQFRHDLSTILEQLRHGLGTFYAHKNMLHTSCTTQAHFMHKLFVPRQALQTDFRATARLEECLR